MNPNFPYYPPFKTQRNVGDFFFLLPLNVFSFVLASLFFVFTQIFLHQRNRINICGANYGIDTFSSIILFFNIKLIATQPTHAKRYLINNTAKSYTLGSPSRPTLASLHKSSTPNASVCVCVCVCTAVRVGVRERASSRHLPERLYVEHRDHSPVEWIPGGSVSERERYCSIEVFHQW